ncbi:hypothetical protein [Bifidobacterium cuniculi]|uniref:Double-glycine peptidase n=1 Tax=Bifidobacterium cuniculi TaxID=1688 RepID=A0A087B4J8_9BIFI|nr:hypothetical protein [Bifidobacterium cuniculi]KFI65948.1 double-glycine peptidase [Bifidobacterium cuniculi]
MHPVLMFILVVFAFVVAGFLMWFAITTIVDIRLMGRLHRVRSRSTPPSSFLIDTPNRIDSQDALNCSGYASAYLLRHHGDTSANGAEIYRRLPGKMTGGYVYPKGIVRFFEGLGYGVRYCRGDLNVLKAEVAKGDPVIVLIRVRSERKWLHYVPVVGYDADHLFLAESLPELVNCSEPTHNRTVRAEDFLALWNTREIKMPLYSHTYFAISAKRQMAES